MPVLAAGLPASPRTWRPWRSALNALDGQLGDGDLGVTMVRGGREVVKALPTLPADVGMALMACAQAFTRASGSSYGTLLATALMSAAKATQGPHRGAMVGGAGAAGGRVAGDDGARQGVAGRQDGARRAGRRGAAPPTAWMTGGDAGGGDRAVDATLERMRGQPAKIGRARIFAERSVGLDDPGQVAFREMLRGLQ